MSTHIGNFKSISSATSATLYAPALASVEENGVYKTLLKDGKTGKEMVIKGTSLDNLEFHFKGGFEMIDLGLASGTKWANMNLGASSESDYGKYYAWGETTGYSASEIGTSKLFVPSDYAYVKTWSETVSGFAYVQQSEYQGITIYVWSNGTNMIATMSQTPSVGNVMAVLNSSGGIDTFGKVSEVNETTIGYQTVASYDDSIYDEDGVLLSQYDAARAELGAGYQMPTRAQYNELLALDHTVETVNGVSGMRFTGSNGNSIFIPFAGDAIGGSVLNSGSEFYCWSSVIAGEVTAYVFNGDSDGGANVYSYGRYSGFSVRAVLPSA